MEESTTGSARFMTFADCAQRVLEVYGEGQPMHYRRIAEIGVTVGWLPPSVRSPEGTLYAQIVTENRRLEKKGEIARFRVDERAFVSMNRLDSSSMEQRIERHNERVREVLLDHLCSVAQQQFEDYIVQVLAHLGFVEIELLGYVSEGDFDMRGTLIVEDVIPLRMCVQVRCGKPSIFSSDIREFREQLPLHERGLLITTGGFAAGAVKEAIAPGKVPIALMSGRQLALLLSGFGVGVRKTAPILLIPDQEIDSEI